jgi:protein O-mannosyl-transferase
MVMSTGRTKSRGKNLAPGPSTAPARTRPRGRAASTVLVVLALVAAAAWSYSTSFAGAFVFDDQYAIVRNPNIRELWPLTRAMSAPPESPVSARPVASLTLAINYALAPPDARDVMTLGRGEPSPGVLERYLRNVWGYHLMNLALHVLAALALFGVVRRTLDSARLRSQFAGASTGLAFAVALVWLVHPLLTDAVTYITQRTEVLMGLFYLLTLYCAIRAWHARKDRSDSRTPGRRAARWWSVAAIAACTLGMGSKQTMATAPFVVLIWDWIFGLRDAEAVPSPAAAASPGESTASRIRRLRWPLYAGLAATWAILVVGVAFERWPHSIGVDREGWTPWTYLLTQTGVIAHYLRLAFVPAPLVLDYDGWPMAHSLLDVAPYAALLIVLLAATAVLVIRRQPWGMAGAWFFALLAPSSSVLPLATEIAAERRMYTAAAGVVALIVIGGYLFGQRLRARVFGEPPNGRTIARVAAVVIVGSIVAGLSVMTSARNRDYWSEERIWQDAVEKRPGNPRARLNYGVQLSMQGRHSEAEAQLREAVRLKDSSASAHGNLGTVLCSLGRLEEGVAQLEHAVALDPDFEAGYRNLGEAYGALGRRGLAAKYFDLAVKQTPDNPFLLNRLGWLLATSPEGSIRNGARAVEVGERAARLTSRQDLQSLQTLAAAYAEADRFDDAVSTTQEAMALANRLGRRDVLPLISQTMAVFEAHQKIRDGS